MSKQKRRGKAKLRVVDAAVSRVDQWRRAIASGKYLFLRDRSLYWAYGSNLNMEAMLQRCPRAVPYRPLKVNNGKLVFRGVADVESSEDRKDFVAGGLWWITEECEAALDRYEGVAHKLYSKRYLDLKVRGEVVSCLFYKMRSEGVQPPYEAYLECIVRGYEDFGLDLGTLSEAVERSHSNKNKTKDLIRRWERRGKPRLAPRGELR